MLVSRIFSTKDDAMSAVADLKQAGFRDGAIEIIEKADDEISVKSLMQQGVSDEARAQHYAEAISQGQTLVIVDAMLGSAARAKLILDRSRPGDAGATITAHEELLVSMPAEKQAVSEAAPLSSKFNWPVLLNDPAPLSRWLNWRTLSDPPTSKPKSHGLPFLSSDPTPLSSAIGMKVLSDNPTPLSSKLGKSTLSDNPAPFSSWIGKPTLSDNPAPFSSWIGKPTLSDNPAPLSSWLGWRTLLDNPTPLSSWLNMRVLSEPKTTKP